ncbi:SDR family NAD(P)-dependent oxidoreductase [Bauldia litoralis]|uniref:3-oxoacyl-[acyl-carrier protein] reductase n=1 Tax=Bauldia litoralis TaxID=665467 RepID=A0A1G6DUZ3_9HYPH|nr:SDR family NAD(P)-dependent oxidoreductase [Bauldia litoralis]SDB48983.1 3-oxoacyl-[acyl-carrier protein] reductase [Bauldia litoralis]
MHNVIVTGGSRGLGLGIATRLAAAGYGVIAVARSQSDELSAAIDAVGEAGTGALRFASFDLTDTDAIPAFVTDIRKSSGAIYGLVNNAGIGTSGLLANMHNSQIEGLIRLNTLAPIVLTKYVTRSMMIEGAGRVINIASIVASNGYSGLSVYSATKASLVGFTRSLAREMGKVGVTVNAIAPGFIDTDMTNGMDEDHHARLVRRSPLRRLTEVDDVARSIEFLLGEGGRSITGTVLTVDAGSTA